MTNQKLFEALERVCGFTALETDMAEIIKAVEADKMPMTEEHKNSIGYLQAAKKEERIFNAEMTKSLRTMTETIEQVAERYVKENFEMYAFPEVIMTVFKDGAEYQSSQPNPHRIFLAHVIELEDLYNSGKITRSRMVEILNEIAAGKHKERIEI